MKKASDEFASRSAVEGCLGLRYINRKSETKEQRLENQRPKTVDYS